MIRILIGDDHAIVRRGLKQILQGETDIVVEGEAASGNEVLQAVRKRPWSAVVLDISMPDRNGLETLSEIRKLRPGLPVLILSMHPEDQFAVRALRAGAAGYLTKESAPEELVSAIRRVVQGRRYVSAALAEKLLTSLDGHDSKPPHAALSDREFHVLCRLAAGARTKELASEMNLSVKTISTYRGRILQKLNLETNAHLTLYAVHHKLI